MKLIFLGAPGSGKGTLATKLAQELNIIHISTGDIVRESIKKEDDLGKKVKNIVENGNLVDDALMLNIVKQRLNQIDVKNGYILDGFPRTIAQADGLILFESNLKVIYFEIEKELIIKRISGRRIHKASGRTYHIEYNPPKTEGKDDLTGENLEIRKDDQAEFVKNRLEVYKEQTEPLIEYFKNKGMLKVIDASKNPSEVFNASLDIIKR